jgi:hypothetical protein
MKIPVREKIPPGMPGENDFLIAGYSGIDPGYPRIDKAEQGTPSIFFFHFPPG